MSKHNIDELRGHLFAALDGLRNKDEPMDLDRAKTIADVAQVLINSAKAENDYLRATGASGASAFMQPLDPVAQLTGPNVRVHRMKG